MRPQALFTPEVHMRESAEARGIRETERLLYEVASELRHVPIVPESRSIHLRALALKRAVRDLEQAPSQERIDELEAECYALFREARALRRDVRARVTRQRSRCGIVPAA
jgi:hypothetical protein